MICGKSQASFVERTTTLVAMATLHPDDGVSSYRYDTRHTACRPVRNSSMMKKKMMKMSVCVLKGPEEEKLRSRVLHLSLSRSIEMIDERGSNPPCRRCMTIG
ncbi:hypothetical protein F2P81_026329 [Scophthalmus maximus]|uniref:Uncharacterized protein n=1 Tax=Scophthalmus maximus TaxID=52904 RepID=A0A6A4RMQ4_SCOMX|nr:hypothetical protein F2P81_026329 [Scophthalmus maximus]